MGGVQPELSAAEMKRRMRIALDVAWQGVANGQSPFGAAIFDRQGELLVAEHNRVSANVDPSAHAEVLTIRKACEQLQQKDLSGHCLVSTCEPCPMCAATIVLSGIDCVIFGATVEDADAAGFIELQIPCRNLFAQASFDVTVVGEIDREACRKLLAAKSD